MVTDSILLQFWKTGGWTDQVRDIVLCSEFYDNVSDFASV